MPAAATRVEQAVADVSLVTRAVRPGENAAAIGLAVDEVALIAPDVRVGLVYWEYADHLLSHPRGVWLRRRSTVASVVVWLCKPQGINLLFSLKLIKLKKN